MLANLKDTFSDKNFLSRIWRIALPGFVQQSLNLLTNMVDVMMIGKLGENAVASVGVAGKFFNIVAYITFGVISGMSILISQYRGADDTKHIRQVTGIGLAISMTAALILGILSHFTPQAMLGIFTDAETIIETGSKYLRILAFCFILQAVSNVFVAGLRAVEIAKPAIFISIGSIATNIFFNWCMIFGHCGFAARGVEGAATATVIARSVELVLTIISVKATRSIYWTNIKNYFSIEKAVWIQYIKTSLPVIFNEMLWGIGIILPTMTYARMSENVAAAMTIVSTYQDIEFVGLLGLSNAAAVIMGLELGAGHTETAKKYEKRFTIIALIVSVILSAFTIIIRDFYIGFYSVQPETAQMVKVCMAVFAITLIWRGNNNIIYIGTLRAGGDTVVCMLMDIIPTWIINLAIIPVLGLKLGLPLWIVYLVAQSDELIKFGFGRHRVKTYKWLKNLNTELTELESE